MSNKEIRDKGRAAFKANYWRCVVAALLLFLFLGSTAGAGAGNAQNVTQQTVGQDMPSTIQEIPQDVGTALVLMFFAVFAVIAIVGIILKIFLFNPLEVGAYRFFSKNANDPSTTLGVIKEGFGRYGHTLGTLLLRDIFLCLWTMLFIIPGIIKAYSYRLVPYIIKDNPELSAMEAIRRSKELMHGNKGRAFLLDLSFIGWWILGILTLGLVNIFWTQPYCASAQAVFYHDLID